MLDWPADRLAQAAGARLATPAPASATPGPTRVVIDSREVEPGDLFVGLAGERADGGRFAVDALAAGAWGVLVAPAHAEAARRARPGVLLAADDPLAALQSLARAWRHELAAQVVGVTGSTGKTTTKDLLTAMVAQQRSVAATVQNRNTEIGLPLTILAAPRGTQVLVLEMAMRGPGQIAELTAIAEPEVGVVVNVGPAHLELMGSLEAVAAAKAELVAGMAPGGVAVLPAGEPLLDVHRREDLRTVTFGPGGDVDDLGDIELPLPGEHVRVDALAALAAARAVGVEPHGRLEVAFSALRGERLELPGPIVVIEDCYNANPMSMRAALDDLALAAPGRRVAVLGDMLELGPDERRYHAEIGAHAQERGVDLLVTVGARAEEMAGGFAGEHHAVADAAQAAGLVPGLVRPGDTVLVKASRGVGLEAVGEALRAARR